ncbi:hypothetical protein DHW03_09175 [Pedobacter yonginense]|uniref:Uncharacterized protein n=1 Tax=Pedobacter yonginense TaxID=651869 RepID=A0A317EP53_9SPHI|nr:hypothetical protein DHW03_09175 [Pedobacter yonginense]
MPSTVERCFPKKDYLPIVVFSYFFLFREDTNHGGWLPSLTQAPLCPNLIERKAPIFHWAWR